MRRDETLFCRVIVSASFVWCEKECVIKNRMMLHGSSVNNCDKDKNEKLSVCVPLKISPQKKKFHKNNEKERKKAHHMRQ